MPRVPQCARVPDAMFYCTALLLLAATVDVFGHSVRKSQQVGIVGGDPVPISEVPYMASLRTFSGFHICGASIIHERFVLTAAHCYYNSYENIDKVAVGTDNALTGDTYDVEKVIPDERFSFKTAEYDIALVKLHKSIIFGPNVKQVDLTDENFKLKTGMMLNATGWGRTEDKQFSDILRQVSLPFVNQSECVNIYGTKGYHNITDKMICAGVNGKGICDGDSGGPLTWNNVQVGITSWSKTCNRHPGVFTKVSVLLSWIKDTIASNI